MASAHSAQETFDALFGPIQAASPGDPSSRVSGWLEALSERASGVWGATRDAIPVWDWHIVETVMLGAIAGVTAFALSWAYTRLIHFLWSSGIDERRALAHTFAPVRFLLVLAVAAIALSPLTLGGGSRATVALIASVLLAVTVGQNILRDVLGGLSLAARRPFTIGDQVELKGQSGRVSDIGLTRVQLSKPDGSVLDIPTRDLSEDRIHTSEGERRSLPIVIEVPFHVSQDINTVVDTMRDQTLLSCYCDASAPVVVEVLNERQVRIRATPIHPDDRDELKSDITARAWTMGQMTDTAR